MHHNRKSDAAIKRFNAWSWNMKLSRQRILSFSALVGATIVVTTTAYGQSNRFDALANLPFEQNHPTAATAKTLLQELQFQQATQAYLWEAGRLR
jgi:hypothetical protein